MKGDPFKFRVRKKIVKNLTTLTLGSGDENKPTPSMKRSYSIKYVLPALVPQMAEAYQALEGVQNGSEAMRAFSQMSKLDSAEKEKMKEALLAYCKLDTLAMVRVLKWV